MVIDGVEAAQKKDPKTVVGRVFRDILDGTNDSEIGDIVEVLGWHNYWDWPGIVEVVKESLCQLVEKAPYISPKQREALKEDLGDLLGDSENADNAKEFFEKNPNDQFQFSLWAIPSDAFVALAAREEVEVKNIAMEILEVIGIAKLTIPREVELERIISQRLRYLRQA